MKLKQLLTDDSAVSPVIGVILMVAITVILAAVIGTFVLGLGDRVSEASPNAQFTVEYKTPSSSLNATNITHDGGDGVEAEQLKVNIGGTEAWDGSDGSLGSNIKLAGNEWSGKITAGSEISLKETSSTAETITEGDTVKIIWTASGSDKTAVIGESEVSL